jgi:hypothetical protein
MVPKTPKETPNTVITAEDIARKAGVPPAAMERAIAHLVLQGNLIPQVSPWCQQCGAVMGDFPSANDVPDELECPECGQFFDISELVLRVSYVVVKTPTDESPGS